MLHRSLRILSFFLLISLCPANSQDRIGCERSSVQPPIVTPAEKVHLFSVLPNGDQVTVVFARLANSTARVAVVRTDGSTTEHTIPGALPEPMGIVGSKIVYTTWNGTRPAPKAFDISSAQRQAFSDDIAPMLLSTGKPDQLAMIGTAADGRLVLRILGPDLAALASHDLHGFTPAQIRGFLLSFAGPNQLLMIDRTAASYVRVNLAPEFTLDAPVRLQGSEIERSKSWPATQTGSFQLKRDLVLAHTPAAGGNNLFFLGPYRGTEGYRAAAFNDAGEQVGAYSFEITAYNREQIVAFDYRTVAMKDEKLILMSASGVIREYKRP